MLNHLYMLEERWSIKVDPVFERFEPITYCLADRGLIQIWANQAAVDKLEFKNSSIILKEKTKEIYVIMSVLISNKDMAKVYVQFFRPK